MSLFAGNVRRNFTLGAIAIAAAHAIARIIPYTLRAMTLAQTVVALLALASLAVFISEHHRRGGNLITIAHEEYVLLATVGFFWLAMLIAWRAIKQGNAGAIVAPQAAPQAQDARGGAGRGVRSRGRGWPYGCSPDDFYCVVEEWSYL